jgi:hypothetical protein
MTAIDEEIDLDVSWEEVIPCQLTGCEDEAAWRGVAKPCGRARLICARHQPAVDMHAKFYISVGKFTCSRADGHPVTHIHWIKL